MSENKKSLMEAVESKGAGIVIPMLNPKDLQVKVSAVVPPAYADALECDKRWSERFKNQCEEVVDQHKDVLDFEDKDRIEGNKPVVAEKPVKVEDQKITESLKDGNCLNEALYGMNQIEQFVKMADAIGLKTMSDFKDFMDREGQGKDVLTALYDYLHNEIGDLEFHAKDESLKESTLKEARDDYKPRIIQLKFLDESNPSYICDWEDHDPMLGDDELPIRFPNMKEDDEELIFGLTADKSKAWEFWVREDAEYVKKEAESFFQDVSLDEVNILNVKSLKESSLKESYLDNIKDPVYWQHQVDYQLEHFGRVGGGLYQDLDEAGFYLDKDYKVTKKVKDTDESLLEDTIKNSKGKWVNKGKEGTHGEFDTKKEADAQRKAMYANGYKENLTEDVEEESSTEEELKEPEAEVKINLEKFKPWGKAVDTYNQIQEAGKMEDFERVLEEGWPDGIKDQTLNELLVEDKDWLAEVLDMEFIDKRVK